MAIYGLVHEISVIWNTAKRRVTPPSGNSESQVTFYKESGHSLIEAGHVIKSQVTPVFGSQVTPDFYDKGWLPIDGCRIFNEWLSYAMRFIIARVKNKGLIYAIFLSKVFAGRVYFLCVDLLKLIHFQMNSILQKQCAAFCSQNRVLKIDGQYVNIKDSSV